MDLRSHIDPETGEPHIYEHDVTEEEVRQVLRRPGEERAGSEGSRVALWDKRLRAVTCESFT